MTNPPVPASTQSLFTQNFSSLKDPRRINKGNIRHSLNEVLFVLISATVSGCVGLESIKLFGTQHLEWLRKFFPYKKGVPSHDTLGRVLASLDVLEFNNCFIKWIENISDLSPGRVVALDGKTICGAASTAALGSKLHIVSAFCDKNKISLGQVTVSEKSNEITAIPKLLELIAIEGCIVTIDAMGCQTDIAKKIIEQKADYILQVKGNQKGLLQEIEDTFKVLPVQTTHTELDMGHGRVEIRKCDVISNLELVEQQPRWEKLTSVVRISAEITDKKSNVTTHNTRYYISSVQPNAQVINHSVRSHWGIENKLHWTLDVVMKEDNQLARKDNLPENLNIIKKIGIGLLNKERTEMKSKPLKMQKAYGDDQYRELILNLF
jgi:predicted transposase YbfD/YdcC